MVVIDDSHNQQKNTTRNILDPHDTLQMASSVHHYELETVRRKVVQIYLVSNHVVLLAAEDDNSIVWMMHENGFWKMRRNRLGQQDLSAARQA